MKSGSDLLRIENLGIGFSMLGGRLDVVKGVNLRRAPSASPPRRRCPIWRLRWRAAWMSTCGPRSPMRARASTRRCGFPHAGDGIKTDAQITGLRLVGIEFDSKIVRVTAEIDGVARVSVSKLAGKVARAKQ